MSYKHAKLHRSKEPVMQDKYYFESAKEKKHTAKLPTFWNRGLLFGGLGGTVLGLLINSLKPSHGWLGFCALLGGVLGGIDGKKKMQVDFNTLSQLPPNLQSSLKDKFDTELMKQGFNPKFVNQINEARLKQSNDLNRKCQLNTYR